MFTTAAFLLGAFVALLNFYTSFLRKPLHALLKSERPASSVSGFPLVGSILLGIAWWRSPPGSALWWASSLMLVLDTGGPHWFVLALIRQGRR